MKFTPHESELIKVAFLTTDARENSREYDKPMPYFGTAPEALLQGLARLPGVEAHVICCIQQPMHAPEKLASNIWFHNLLVPKMGWLRTGYQGCVRAVRQKLREIRPDVVHAQGTERDCGLSGVFSGYPNVLTVHGNMRLISKVNRARPFTYQWLAARLETITLPRAGGVVCITRYTEDAVSALAKKTWVVPNAVDAAFFEVKPAREKVRTVLCVGSICLLKNQQQFIQALDPLSNERAFRVVFLGGASQQVPYGAGFFKMLETRPWCVYGGFANREQLKTHLGEATLLALPSLEDNCPMVVLEAMAAGVPVVAAKVGGLPDLIQDEINGLFCDPADPSSIRRSIQRLLDDPQMADGIANRAKQLAITRYHPETIARRHVEIYWEVLSAIS